MNPLHSIPSTTSVLGHKHYMTLDECFVHPQWPVFKDWMINMGYWYCNWAWADAESRWRPYWDCFLTGYRAAKVESSEVRD